MGDRNEAAGRGKTGRVVGRLLLVAFACVAVPGRAQAREVAVRGSAEERFGRILLQFDETTKVQVRSTGGVMVIGFAAPARITAERLVAELGRYVSAVRRDPDGTGLRLALTAPVRANVLEAGEKVFVDLLPPGWTGLPPALPPEVVAELAERARVAEARLKEEARRTEPPKPVTLRVAQLPGMTRLVLDLPPGTPARFRDAPKGQVDALLSGALAFDAAGEKPALAAGVKTFTAMPEGRGLAVKVTAAPPYEIARFAEGDTLVVDLVKPGAARAATSLAEIPPAPPPPAAVASAAPVVAVAAASPSSAPAPPPPPAAAGSAPAPEPAAPPPGPPVTIRPAVTAAGEDGPSILFPFRTRTAAAAFRRGDRLTVVFDTADILDAAALAAASAALPADAARLDGTEIGQGFAVLRFTERGAGGVRLAPEGDGWRLLFGSSSGLPPDAARIARGTAEDGQAQVTVSLAAPASLRWLAEPDGTRIAVATAFGRPQAVPLRRRFVEFTLPSTLQGVVVEARADDLLVGFGAGGVVVRRDAGLVLSPVETWADGPGGETSLVLGRAGWSRDTAPPVLARYQALVREAADAGRSARAEARFRLARFMVSNGLDVEALSVLALARAEDPVFARRRETIILSGVAALRARRMRDAREFLASDILADDPEAELWRAMIDLAERRWDPALAGLRRAREVVEAYPDDLAARIRLGAFEASLERGDVARAERELAAIDRLPSGTLPRDEHDLARARFEEAAGRTETAFKTYERLGAEAGRQIAADATLRALRLGARTGALRRDTVVARLEGLSVTWRGDATELGTIVELARQYQAEGRWRDLFTTTRRAGRYFPLAEETRALHDETAHAFENLLLGTDGAKLPAVNALALYFDFRELAPVGRRGDELVRRLADRLVELDLLDQAADLLQHQVDRRLSGAGRATVASRLAAIRLMSGRPLLALSVLHATRMAELPDSARRQRLLLEARAQADLTRVDLALEVLEGESGPDAERMRGSVLWSAHRWREAGESVERLLGDRWRGPDPLSDRERQDTVRAAVSYVMADDGLGLDRLRQKFAAKMADSPDARTFDILMRPGAIRAREFRTIALDASRADALRQLMADWKDAAPKDLPEPSPAGPAASGAAATGAGPAPSDGARPG